MTSVDLPAFGRPGDRDLQRPVLGQRVFLVVRIERRLFRTGAELLGQRQQRGIEVAHPLAVFRRQADGIAQAKAIAFVDRVLPDAPLGLVHRQDDLRARTAQQVGEDLVGRRDPRTGVGDEQAGIRVAHGVFRQLAHPAGQAFIGRLLQPRGVHHGKAQIAQPRLALAQVAGDTRLVIDQRQALADQPVEQGRFADIGPADDGEGESHGAAL